MIVLIHGSTQSASCWDRVRPHLGEAMTIELPANHPDATATDFARIAVDQMRDAPDDCIVVGHSAAGSFLPHIAQLRPVGAVGHCPHVSRPRETAEKILAATPSL